MGDNLITYDNCGSGNGPGSWQCNGQTPGSSTEGPQHIWIVNNTFHHCVQAGIHINGGSFIYVANNKLTDCNLMQEEDPGTNQIMQGVLYNSDHRSFGEFDTNAGPTYPPGVQFGGWLTCVGDPNTQANGSGCWAVQNTLSGCASNGSCLAVGIGNCPNVSVAGNTTGNYYGNILQNGAYVNGAGRIN